MPMGLKRKQGSNSFIGKLEFKTNTVITDPADTFVKGLTNKNI